MASFKELMKQKSERQSALILASVCMALLAVVVVAIVPRTQQFLIQLLTGWKGLLYLLAAGVLLTLWLRVLGLSGKSLRYAIIILIFTIVCIWLYINIDLVWNSMVNTLGLWPTIIIALLGAVGIWIIVHMLL